MNIVRKSFQYGDHEITLETGRIARQANGAVLATMGETVVLATVVGRKESKDGTDFFPLTVNYQEKFYAAGRIPGGYLKREGRPGDNETLISRLIDRPIRPLFPKHFNNEVQVVVTVMSYDPAVQTDILSMIAASAALSISDIPFDGPIGAARVGFKDGGYLLNPSVAEVADSELDLVVAGSKEAVLMVESEAKELSETVMLGAVIFGHQQQQIAIDAINALVKDAGKTKWDWQPPEANTALEAKLKALTYADIQAAYNIQEKQERYDRVREIHAVALEKMLAEDVNACDKEIYNIIHAFESEIVRNKILNGEPRIDGRDTQTVRPIDIELSVLPRAHGSVLFTRGETQAIVALTLGTDRDEQRFETLDGDNRDGFMLHYNFPPYSVGETGMMGSPKRREIGHGKLAKRALMAVLPQGEASQYCLRAVSEITESNGSSSMATVCGTSLAMMDAGVAIKAPVAGVAMGLIKEDDRFAVLTDILGDEDHLGDMDFKVAGTREGVTALQMDIKIQGITQEIMAAALEQANHGRLHILGVMEQAINLPRDAVSKYAPRFITLKIKPEKIRDVIGKGGAIIKALTEETGCSIDINDDGTIKIAATDVLQGNEAKRRIEEITEELEIGKIYNGEVVKITEFGAFVAVLPNQQGLVHISQIMEGRVENVRDHLEEGQIVRVKVVEIDRQGRVRLSMKEAIV
ncbi:MAG: polyribonucleotide nucleotidyltransferase [Gammaproteobacteria bacterium RIFCSPHIGHO2_12_FULL_41_15]|nr:MAG: polyribonucleotide nucleotidyltransferase [Gammaproteobacteria bacterium RIFCSPHIGHO2_12_FULL_41_15]